MSAPLPAATVTGVIHCALCGQVSVKADDMPMRELVSLVRAHQRSETCS